MLYQAIQIFHKGGWIMWPLLVLALAAIAVSVERTLAIRKAASDNDAFIEDLRKRLNAADFEGALQLCDQTPGPVPQLLASGIRTRHLDNASIERAMEELALRQTPLLHKRLGVLDTVITMAPLLGLLGTITGMIQSFNVVSTAGSSAPTAITGGVAEALIATAAGLTIAIMTLPVYNYLTERVKEIVADMEVRATQLLNILASLRGTGASLSEGTLHEAAAH
jgi:biopolymer transport protein ExbB